jgi:hypothetical protein
MPQHQMRTTLQLDDDVLAAARVLARQQRTSLGAVSRELARQALVAPAPGSSAEPQGANHRNGLPLLPWKETGAPVDLELVNNLRDELA